MNVSVTGGGVLPVMRRWSGCVGMYLIYCNDCRARYNVIMMYLIFMR